MSSPLLAVRDLSVRYGAETALEEASFDLDAGSSLAVIGANGSGKSTLLNAIAGLIDAARGTVSVEASECALVLQATSVDAGLPITVRDTVRLARYPRVGLFGWFNVDDHRAVDDAMGRLGVDHLADRQLHELSGGQRQRVLVAQGLAQQAELLLLDEPATGMDIPSREKMLDVVDACCASGQGVVMTTHDLADARRLDNVLVLAGRQVAHGPPGEVLRRETLQEAFGGAVMTLGDGVLLMDDPHHDHD